jgi:16S rRNA (uracil1498-N3)-methyltransferase
MAHFYLAEALETTTVGATVLLEGPEARHAATVSRVRIGETLAIGNGRGLMLNATVVQTTKESVELLVETMEHIDSLYPRITLVQALAKTDRDERAVEASTELGVDAVIPWAADRSISKWEGPKIDKGISRWTAIVREATKQSIRAFIPQVGPHLRTAQLIEHLEGKHVLVLDPTATLPVSKVDCDERDIALIVGPEGGISESELERFVESGATLVTLGRNILRTSTAGPAALAIINAKLGRC